MISADLHTIPIDLHTHTAASGHGTEDTISDLAKAARTKGMTVLGISDHGPSTPGACKESYFRSLKMAPKTRYGVKMLYGAEANIVNEMGLLDIRNEILKDLDFVIASIHKPTYHPYGSDLHCLKTSPAAETAIENTKAYIRAMENPYVKVLGHIEDENFPINLKCVVDAAIYHKVILEVNEVSLAPDSYRGNGRPLLRDMLVMCKKRRHPILISSDSHGSAHIGEAPYALGLLRELDFPEDLVLNFSRFFSI